MRRMNGRSPPFAIIGLLLVLIVLAYNYWTLTSQNGDLRKEIDKLQAEVKISGVKQDQFEKKNELLQSNLHDLDEKSERLQKQVADEDTQLKEAQKDIKKKEYEITSLKSDLMKKLEYEKVLKQQIEDNDAKIEELTSDSQHILGLKNDAEEALGDKDNLINDLKRQLEQVKSLGIEYEVQLKALKNNYNKMKLELSVLRKEAVAEASPPSVHGPMNIPNIEKKESYKLHGSLTYVPKMVVHTRDIGFKGMKFHPGSQILPSQPSNVLRAKPRFSVASIRASELHKESANQIQQPASEVKVEQQMKEEGQHINPENNVIPNPPLDKEDSHVIPVDHVVEKPNQQKVVLSKPVNPPKHDNQRRLVPLDLHEDLQEPVNVALNEVDHADPNLPVNPNEDNVLPQPPQNPDDNLDTAVDEEEKAMEDPLDDQDEEGKEIKKDLENNADDNYNNDDDYENEEKQDNNNPGVNPKFNSNHEANLEPRGIGAGRQEIPKVAYDKNISPFGKNPANNRLIYDNNNNNNNNEVNLDDEIENKANERVFESSFDNKLRNLGRHL